MLTSGGGASAAAGRGDDVRLLCRVGVHDWLTEQVDYVEGDHSSSWTERRHCWHCGKTGEWQTVTHFWEPSLSEIDERLRRIEEVLTPKDIDPRSPGE